VKARLVTVLASVAATYGLQSVTGDRPRNLDVDRLAVRQEPVVSDTGAAWEKGFEDQQIPRGLYARPAADRPGGLWVRSRLIKGEVDDSFGWAAPGT
jgi:hypothetical protein